MSLPAILQQLNKTLPLPNLQGVKQMIDMVRSAGNPNAMLQSMMQNNPQMQQVMNLVQQHGNDPQKAFYALCEQRGIDPQPILDTLKTGLKT